MTHSMPLPRGMDHSTTIAFAAAPLSRTAIAITYTLLDLIINVPSTGTTIVLSHQAGLSTISKCLGTTNLLSIHSKTPISIHTGVGSITRIADLKLLRALCDTTTHSCRYDVSSKLTLLIAIAITNDIGASVAGITGINAKINLADLADTA